MKELFGKIGGRPIMKYTFGENGIEASVLNFGATLQSLVVDGTDVILGFPRGEDYGVHGGYLSANVGRVANRIAGAAFSLNGTTYQLAKNEGNNHLHGGKNGFHLKFYEAKELEHGVKMTAFSPDGEEGYPGNLTHSVTCLIEGRTLRIQFEARSDRDTIWAPTSHIYFNLNGEVGNATSNELTIYADSYTPVDSELIPLGSITPVGGTPFDFTQSKPVERDLAQVGGYDINFMLRGEHAATMVGDRSGLRMEVYTDMPCLQLYSGIADMGGIAGKRKLYHAKEGIALEPQFAPNAINMAGFRKPILPAGKTETHHILLAF